jgi:hypothetical protein
MSGHADLATGGVLRQGLRQRAQPPHPASGGELTAATMARPVYSRFLSCAALQSASTAR